MSEMMMMVMLFDEDELRLFQSVRSPPGDRGDCTAGADRDCYVVARFQ